MCVTSDPVCYHHGHNAMQANEVNALTPEIAIRTCFFLTFLENIN
jgi:hypothetical protein